MPKEDRKHAVLQFMAEAGLALQPSNIYFNMRKRGATFGKKSVERYLKEWVEEGYIKRIEDSDGFYEITQSGIDYLEDRDET